MSDSSFTQGEGLRGLWSVCNSQYAGSVSILSGMCFTMTVSSKKLLFFSPRLIKGLMIEFVVQLKSNSTVIFLSYHLGCSVFPGMLA